MSMITVDTEGHVVGDAEEMGRRLQSFFAAMSTLHPTHEATVAHYYRNLDTVLPAECFDLGVEGSWGWWAAKLLCDPARHGDEPSRPVGWFRRLLGRIGHRLVGWSR